MTNKEKLRHAVELINEVVMEARDNHNDSEISLDVESVGMQEIGRHPHEIVNKINVKITSVI